MKTLKEKIVEILEKEIPAILTELAFLGQIPKEKGHHQGFSGGQVIKNNSEIIASQILSFISQDKEELVEKIEGLRWNFDCDCNICWSNKKAISQVLSILKEKK